MSAQENVLIPLDDAHEVLGTFGIGPYSTGYQRWRRDDGFRMDDLETVLNESPSILRVDWRECLADAAETIIAQLAAIEIQATVDLPGEDQNQGTIEVDGRVAGIKYVPDDSDDFGAMMTAINGVIAGKARYRKFRSCEGSDGWAFALLRDQEWDELQANAPRTVDLLFCPDDGV